MTSNNKSMDLGARFCGLQRRLHNPAVASRFDGVVAVRGLALTFGAKKPREVITGLEQAW